MNYLIFKLSMPHRGSWNNKWSGENINYTIAKRFYKNDFKKLPDIVGKYHEYRWDDGWTAVVKVQHLTNIKEVKQLTKNSKGFCGYDWMIESLLKFGKIMSRNDQEKYSKGE